MALFSKSLPGISVPHRKNTRDCETQVMPVPDVVVIPMSQHMGQPCDILVKPKDEVKVGQLIGSSQSFLSSPVHSSVSGQVLRVEEITMPNGARVKAVVIQADKEQTLHPDIHPPVINSREDFGRAVMSAGIVGLGGAGFPTHIKLNPKNLSEVDTLVINAAECEPYITSDYRTMLEDSGDVMAGIKAIMEHLEIANCYIGIEDNKPEAIQEMRRLAERETGVHVVRLRSKYPQGAEKVIIYETTRRVVPEGKLPSDVGVIVANVTTVAKIARYLKDGVPLIGKRITVDGGAVKEPKNVRVLIGTPIKDVMEFCGGYRTDPAKILMGGPMMGTAVRDDSFPIIKNNNAILAFDSKEAKHYDETACIRCGRCVRTCPMNLMPLRIEDSFVRENLDDLKKYKVNLCMECGCCSFACPAKRHLVQTNRLAKVRLRAAAQAEQKKS